MRSRYFAQAAAYLRRHYLGLIAIILVLAAGTTATALPTEPTPVASLNGSGVADTTGGAGRVVQSETAKAKILPWNKPGPGDIDTDAMHSFKTAPQKFTIIQPGLYQVYAKVEWLPGNGLGDRTLEYHEIQSDGSGLHKTRLAKSPGQTYTIEQGGEITRRLDPGDVIRISVRQTSGAQLGVLARHISIVWAGP